MFNVYLLYSRRSQYSTYADIVTSPKANESTFRPIRAPEGPPWRWSRRPYQDFSQCNALPWTGSLYSSAMTRNIIRGQLEKESEFFILKTWLGSSQTNIMNNKISLPLSPSSNEIAHHLSLLVYSWGNPFPPRTPSSSSSAIHMPLRLVSYNPEPFQHLLLFSLQYPLMLSMLMIGSDKIKNFRKRSIHSYHLNISDFCRTAEIGKSFENSKKLK